MTKPVLIEEGEFAGWRTFPRRSFEYDPVGPFYSRKETDGGIVTAVRCEAKHLNLNDVAHGGMLMTLADNALFNIAQEHLRDSAGSVTVTFNSEFLGAAVEGDLLEARGEVTRAGGSLIFVRGLVTAERRPCLAFSGTIKKLRRRG
jgi:uncharacterized protein (TIGR00369 family)